MNSFTLGGYCSEEVYIYTLQVRGALEPTLKHNTWKYSGSNNIIQFKDYGTHGGCVDDGLGMNS
jgi:hypothetical protein